MIGGFQQVIRNEGAGALLTGFGPTFAGYFIQGAFKFGGYEFFKQQSIDFLGIETARKNRAAVYSISAASAEFFASIALSPLEATRIRLVSTPGFATGLVSGFSKILTQEGIGAFYSGFVPILFKQYVIQAPPLSNTDTVTQGPLYCHKVCCIREGFRSNLLSIGQVYFVEWRPDDCQLGIWSYCWFRCCDRFSAG